MTAAPGIYPLAPSLSKVRNGVVIFGPAIYSRAHLQMTLSCAETNPRLNAQLPVSTSRNSPVITQEPRDGCAPSPLAADATDLPKSSISAFCRIAGTLAEY